MAGSHINKGTVFLHSCNKSKKLERAVNRMRERLGRKSAARYTRDWKGRGKASTDSSPSRSQQTLADDMKKKGEGQDDTFMPQLTGLTDFRFRSELLNLMGTEVIRLNDNTWSKRFHDQLRSHYEMRLDRQEHILSEAERKRLHKLRIDGHIVTQPGDNEESGPMKSNFPPLIVTSKKHQNAKIEEHLMGGDRRPMFRDDYSNAKAAELVVRLLQKTYVVPKELPNLDYLQPSPEGIRIESTDCLRARREKSLERSASTEMAERKRRRLPREVAKLYEEKTVAGLYARAKRLILPRPKVVEEEKKPEPEETNYKSKTTRFRTRY